MAPGILYVTMEPNAGLLPAQFHEWYNNEHGPTRLRLPHIFANGLRFRATDGRAPTFLAAYDVTDMHQLLTPTYTDLRANRSAREAATIGQVAVHRQFFDLLLTRQSPQFVPLEDLTDAEAAGIQLVAVQKTLRQDLDGAEAAYRRWYEDEHVEMLSRVPGWLRTRWFRSSSVEEVGEVAFLGLHEYAKVNGLGGEAHKAATSTKWRDEVNAQYVQSKTRRTYELFYVFGPAPRDVVSLTQLPATTGAFVSADGQTRTDPGPDAVLKSYVTASDGLVIPYQLEGNSAPDAPTVVFVNSLLTSLAMWDPLIALLRAQRPDLRLLRYDHRGRHVLPQPPQPATPTLLAQDLHELQAALRIPSFHAVVGVSMGGVTTLAFALTYPNRLGKFIACDFNVSSSAANTQAWKDRTAVAEEDDGQGIKTKLAAQTVARWFHPATMAKEDRVKAMEAIVAGNNVEGFKYGCQALWDYDMKSQMGTCEVPALLVVGDGDAKGALVKAMEGFRPLLGKGEMELRTVKDTGHLPMFEDAESFWEVVKDWV